MAGRVNEVREKLNQLLYDPTKPWTQALNVVEAKTGVNRLYLFVVGIAGLALWLMFGLAAQLVCNFIGFIYPAYASIIAIESHSKDDDTKWLTYWVVFAVFSIVEFFADFIVGWFPLYWLSKCVFMIWLMIPIEYNGSIILYTRIVKPYFLKIREGFQFAADWSQRNNARACLVIRWFLFLCCFFVNYFLEVKQIDKIIKDK